MGSALASALELPPPPGLPPPSQMLTSRHSSSNMLGWIFVPAVASLPRSHSEAWLPSLSRLPPVAGENPWCAHPVPVGVLSDPALAHPCSHMTSAGRQTRSEQSAVCNSPSPGARPASSLAAQYLLSKSHCPGDAGLLTLRDKCFLACASAEKASVFLGRVSGRRCLQGPGLAQGT